MHYEKGIAKTEKVLKGEIYVPLTTELLHRLVITGELDTAVVTGEGIRLSNVTHPQKMKIRRERMRQMIEIPHPI